MNMHVVPKGVMEVMDPTGHTTVTWNPDDQTSVADAQREFDRLRRNGYSAFRLDVTHENGCVTEQKGELINRFDPQAGKVMMVPQLEGG